MPSVAFAFWFSSVFIVSTNMTEWLALTGLIASVLSLLFYILNLDIFITREVLRNNVRAKQKADLEKSIPVFNVFLQIWQISSEMETDESWLNRWIDNCISDGVASYPVRSRSWYWRFSLYSSFAISILLLMPHVSRILGLQQTFYLNVPITNVVSLQFILFLLLLAGLILPWLANYWRDYRGSKNFTRDTRYVAEFQYLQHLAGLDCIKRPEFYLEKSSLLNLKQELEALQIFLYRGDWSIFVRRWAYLRQVLIDEVTERINSLYYYDLILLWTNIVTEHASKIHSKKRLELLCQIASHLPPTGLASEFINLISENYKLRDPSVIDIVEFFTEERKQQHKEIDNVIHGYYATGEYPNYMNEKYVKVRNRLNSLGVKL